MNFELNFFDVTVSRHFFFCTKRLILVEIFNFLGLDGITRKLKLDSSPVQNDAAKPENQTENISPLPFSLNEALTALENDEVMVDQLGADFIKCFCTLKRSELKRMEENEKNDDIGAWYRENYATYI